MKKKILITGTRGFVGRHLLKQLVEAGIDYVEYCGDINEILDDLSTLKKVDYKGITHCVHLAAKTFVPDSWENPGQFYQVNCMGTVNALEVCRKIGAKFIFISTCVYADTDNRAPLKEDNELMAKNPYSHSKLLSEKICEFYSAEFGVDVIILRPFNIYGPEQRKEFLISKLIDQFVTCEKYEVENLLPRRDYIYIDDFISAIIVAINCDVKFGIYNVGTGKSYSVKEIIDILGEISGSQREVISKNIQRKNEREDIVADISKIKQELGWEPTVDIKEGLKKTMEVFEVKIGNNNL